ncbi:MAG: hypothetical protein RLZZ303_916 [Candidatus Hydrogenedentota bacterium]|jgi:nucleoside-diphosphate-sugar epimerase
MPRTLIVGCGYVGSALAHLLAERGHEVWGMRRSRATDANGIRWLQGDVLAPESLAFPDALDHVVYAVSADASTEDSYRAAYVTGLRNVLEGSRRAGQSPRVVFVSSTGVYHQDDGTWLEESSPTQPRGFSGRLLLEGENLLHDSTFPGVVLRLSGIYGPGRGRTVDSVRSGGARRVRGSKAVLNHIHRDDCAGAIAHVLSLPDPAPLYLGTDCEPTLKNEVLSWVASQLGLPDPPEVDAEPGAGIHRGGHRFYSNKRLTDSGYVFLFPSYREGYKSLLGLPGDNPIP